MLDHRHFVIYKPFGYLSQFVCEHKKKKLLGDLYDFPAGAMAIGRLDEDSEGLLLITTDGKVSEEIRGAHIEKEYYAQLDGIISDEALEKLKTGVEIGFEGIKYQTLPCKVKRLDKNPELPPRGKKIRDDRHGPTGWISIILQEGKNRQVRKMTAAVGFPTLRLVRWRVGSIQLGDLNVAEVKELSALI